MSGSYLVTPKEILADVKRLKDQLALRMTALVEIQRTCDHRYKVVSTRAEPPHQPTGYIHTLECERCGLLKDLWETRR